VNVDLGEFRAAFVAEAEEHLSAVQSLLLKAERSKREGKRAPRELRELMRLIHTLKGLSAMVGVDAIVALAHRMETALRQAERAGALMDERMIEVLLASARAIESRIRIVAEDRTAPAPPPELLAALDGLEAPAPQAVAELPLDPLLASKLGPAERHQLEAGAHGGKRAVRVDFAPSPEKAAGGLTIGTVRERLAPLAEIVKVIPMTSPPSREVPSGLSFALVLLTDATDEAIAEAVGVAPTEVETVFAPEAPAPEPISTEEDTSLAPGSLGLLRVEVGRVDDAIQMLGGLVVTRARMAHAIERVEAAGGDARELRALMLDSARQLRDLRAALLRVRMVPMTVVLERLPLLVRGLARASGKLVHVELDVGSGELDRNVAEGLFPALVHLVRNAVDHGIELPEERARMGKSEVGTIRIRSEAHDRIELRVSDDGRGVDREAVAARAGEPVPATDAELLALLCRPGLSTRSEADTMSGRGMGMDIVHKVVVRCLGGEIVLETRPHVGTTFVLRVPLTVAIVDALIVRCAGERYAIPVSTVEEIVDLSQEQIVDGASAGRRRAMRYGLLARRGGAVPVFDLCEVLGLSGAGAEPHALLVRRGDGELVAYAVERVLGQQEVVVRPLLDPLVASPAVSGTTDLGDGRATVVLDLVALTLSLDSRQSRGGAA
jgi:two-component system chemotaxis sensor kinase CheA